MKTQKNKYEKTENSVLAPATLNYYLYEIQLDI